MNPLKLLRSGGLHILLYHRVLERPDPLRPYDPDVRQFSAQLRMLRRFFNPVGLSEGLTALENGSLPPRSVAVTFDDGYRDNLEIAVPVLNRLDIPATVFVATGFIDGQNMWNDRIIEAVRQTTAEALDLEDLGLGTYRFPAGASRFEPLMALLRSVKPLPTAERLNVVDEICRRCGHRDHDRLMMHPEEIRRLSRSGCEIGAHTVNHPILASVDDAAAEAEISESKADLEAICAGPVKAFAYPNGTPARDYTARDVALVKAAGFRYAFSTRPALADDALERLEIPRFGLWSQASGRYAAQIARRFAA